MAQLGAVQYACVTDDPFIYGSLVPVRGGIAVGAHGWAAYSGTARVGILPNASASEAPASDEFRWWCGYEFSNGQPANGQYEEVASLSVFHTTLFTTYYVTLRRYNVSGSHVFRFWRTDTDVQIGADSAAYSVGVARRFFVRYRESTDELVAFVDGTQEITTTFTYAVTDIITAGASGGAASVGTTRYWSAWAQYFSATDDVDETHYPEMALLNPESDSSYEDYTGVPDNTNDYLNWDDWANDGVNDIDASYEEAVSAANQRQASNLTNVTMVNTIRGVAVFLLIKHNTATKAVVHGALLHYSGTDKVVSFGSDTLLTTPYQLRSAVYHTPPGGGAWSQTIADGLVGGHRRDADATNQLITALGLVVVSLGATNKAPPKPLHVRKNILVSSQAVHRSSRW